MNKVDAALLTQKAHTEELSELGRVWLDQLHAAVRHDAERGFRESEVRILAPPALSTEEAVRLGIQVVARLERGGFRCRLRPDDTFLRDGPAIVGPGLRYERGTTLLWLEFDVDWD